MENQNQNQESMDQQTNELGTEHNMGGSADNANDSVTMSQGELDKLLQQHSDKRVTNALKTAQVKWEKEFTERMKSEQEEASKLAKMSKEERERASLAKERQQFEEERKKFQREALELETVKQLAEKKLPTAFASFLLGSDAEQTYENINHFEEAFRSSIEVAVTDRLRGSSPKASTHGNTSITKEQFRAMGYTQRLELMNTNPELYKKLSN